MSIIHVNQIKNHVKRLFEGVINMSDAATADTDRREDLFLDQQDSGNHNLLITIHLLTLRRLAHLLLPSQPMNSFEGVLMRSRS